MQIRRFMENRETLNVIFRERNETVYCLLLDLPANNQAAYCLAAWGLYFRNGDRLVRNLKDDEMVSRPEIVSVDVEWFLENSETADYTQPDNYNLYLAVGRHFKKDLTVHRDYPAKTKLTRHQALLGYDKIPW